MFLTGLTNHFKHTDSGQCGGVIILLSVYTISEMMYGQPGFDQFNYCHKKVNHITTTGKVSCPVL